MFGSRLPDNRQENILVSRKICERGSPIKGRVKRKNPALEQWNSAHPFVNLRPLTIRKPPDKHIGQSAKRSLSERQALRSSASAYGLPYSARRPLYEEVASLPAIHHSIDTATRVSLPMSTPGFEESGMPGDFRDFSDVETFLNPKSNTIRIGWKPGWCLRGNAC
jgi:hypothetical protein